MAANASYVNELFNIKTALPREYFGHFNLNIISWAAAEVCLYFHSHMNLHVLCCQSYLGNLLVRYSSVVVCYPSVVVCYPSVVVCYSSVVVCYLSVLVCTRLLLVCHSGVVLE